MVRHGRVIQMREHRKINDSQRSVTDGERTPVDEILPDVRAHHQAPGAYSHPDGLVQRRQEVSQSRRLYPVAQIEGSGPSHEEGVSLLDRSGPVRLLDAGQ